MRKALALLLLCLASMAHATVAVTAKLLDGSGHPIRISFLQFDLAHCGFNIPAIPSATASVVQKSFRMRAGVNGAVSGTVYGHDEIACGNSYSTLWHVTAFSDSNTKIAGDYDYDLEASLGHWELSSAQPFVGALPPPGFQAIFANPTQNQRITQPNGTTLSFYGRIDFNHATIDFTTGTVIMPQKADLVGGKIPPSEMASGDVTNPSLCSHGGSPSFTMGSCGGDSANATSFQGNAVATGTATAAGQSYVWDGTHFVLRKEVDIDAVAVCALPTDTTTDFFPAMKACVNAHPSAHIRLGKVRTTAGCDFMTSDSIFTLGQGMWIDGSAAGTGNGAQGTTICTTKPGVTPFVAINNYQGARISNLTIVGSESWSRGDATTYKLPFGFSYPGILWVTATTTASSGTITVNGTNEKWTNQTDGQTVRIAGAGQTLGTVTVSTTANNYTLTCACIPAMIGETVAIPGALGGNTLYAHIIGTATAFPYTTPGNVWLDRAPTSSVSGVTATLSYDYYGTIASHSSGAAALLNSPFPLTSVSNSTITVGSEADGVRSAGVGNRIDHNAIFSMGRHAINVSNTFYGTGTGGASLLSDEVQVDSNVLLLNRGDGIYCQGGDCNVNKYSLSTINQNQLWGIDDSGFLINTIDTVNTASNHVAAVATSGILSNGTATWNAATPFLVTDGTCTNASNTITTTSSGKFFAVQADAVNGMIVKLTNCGTGGSTDLVTFITGYTSANSVTVQDAPTCGGSCPSGGSATFQSYPTVTTLSGTAFDPSHVGHMAQVYLAGAAGQVMITTTAIYYSANKIGLNKTPTNPSFVQAKSILFGTGDNVQEANWQKAWDFSTGSMTQGSAVLTLSAANELFIASMCNAATNLRQVVTVVGAEAGGLDLSTTCSIFTNNHQVTLSKPAGTTVSGVEVMVEQDGGPYAMRGGSCLNCYEEQDQAWHSSKFGSGVFTTPSIRNIPATLASNSYAPFGAPIYGNTLCGFVDQGCTIRLQAGRSVQEQVDINWYSITDFTTKMAQISMTSGNIWNFLVGQQTLFSMAPNVARLYYGDPAVTSGVTHRFRGNSNGQDLFYINADASLQFGFNSSSANWAKLTENNTANRTYTLQDATETLFGSGAPSDYASGLSYLFSGHEQATPGVVPAAAFQEVYVKAGSGICALDHAGTERCSSTGSGYTTVRDEGTPLTQRATIDFAGAGVTCADSGGTKTLCTIPGTASGLPDPVATGVIVEDGPGSTQARTLTAGSTKLSITNGTGAAGNPTFDVVPANIDANALLNGVSPTTSNAFTNKTEDVEGTGNVFTIPIWIALPAGGCNATTPAPAFDLPTASAAVADCLGTTTTTGVLDYVDGSTTGATAHFTTPPDWDTSKALDITVYYTGDTGSTSNIRWSVAVGCVADGQDTIAPTFNTASAANSAGPSTPGLRKSSAFTGVDKTNCAAGETMWITAQRIGADAGDVYAGVGQLIELGIKLRRTM